MAGCLLGCKSCASHRADRTIPINAIKSIVKSRNIISSPAWSLDRLEIKYGDNKTVLVSPKNKAAFLSHIGWDDKVIAAS